MQPNVLPTHLSATSDPNSISDWSIRILLDRSKLTIYGFLVRDVVRRLSLILSNLCIVLGATEAEPDESLAVRLFVLRQPLAEVSNGDVQSTLKQWTDGVLQSKISMGTRVSRISRGDVKVKRFTDAGVVVNDVHPHVSFVFRRSRFPSSRQMAVLCSRRWVSLELMFGSRFRIMSWRCSTRWELRLHDPSSFERCSSSRERGCGMWMF